MTARYAGEIVHAGNVAAHDPVLFDSGYRSERVQEILDKTRYVAERILPGRR